MRWPTWGRQVVGWGVCEHGRKLAGFGVGWKHPFLKRWFAAFLIAVALSCWPSRRSGVFNPRASGNADGACVAGKYHDGLSGNTAGVLVGH